MRSSRPKVLYVVHGHPRVAPGGGEVHALELYEAMAAGGAFEPLMLAHAGPERAPPGEEGPLIGAAPDGANQYLFDSGWSDFDFLFITSPHKRQYTEDYHRFLLEHRPDVVHFHHTVYLGVDMLRQTRNTLPHAPIVYTLHEYVPICHHFGQMVRRHDGQPCTEASPARCHECFPDIAPETFLARKHFVQSHLSLVDLFLAPSRFLLERYVAWGIPPAKIRYEEYGRPSGRRCWLPAASSPSAPKNRFGFFGQLGAFKGADVLLRAARILAESGTDVHVTLHGANLERQPSAYQDEMAALLASASPNVTFAGRYEQTRLSALMAQVDWVVVPSIWWENSPLVIQEAFMHGRPVICSGIGGMAEKVVDGVNGLHFRTGDAPHLAQTMATAACTPGLWERLRDGIPEVYTIEESARTLASAYAALLGRRTVGDASA